MRLIATLVAIVLLTTALVPRRAVAIVTASAEWNWAEYQRDVDGTDRTAASSTEASHFYQTYSLFYRDRQPLLGGRAGMWSFGLGYEWSTLDTSFSSNDGSIDGDSSVNQGKLLFDGELRFNPRGLPFTLQVFSRDMQTPNPSTVYASAGTIIDPGIYNGLNNGQYVTSGLTLLAGGEGANLFGGYREELAALPRLLVDYREEYVRNVDTGDEQHYRTRDLAFVSLNRRNNWFHYKVFEHTDFNDSTNDYTERVWLLGTIDHINRRHWINLTNWLKISVDASLTRTDSPGFLRENDETYRLNLFSIAQRRQWNFSNFTTLSRLSDDTGKLEKDFDFPFFASGQLDPLHDWRLTLIGTRWEDGNRLQSAARYENSEDTLYGGFQLENRRFSGKILTSSVELDWLSDTQRGDGQAARLGFELQSSRYKGQPGKWLAAYSVAWFDSNTAETSYTEQVAVVSGDTQLSPAVTIGARQEVALGVGGYSSNTTNRLTPTISQGFLGELDQERNLDGTTYRAVSSAYLEFHPSARWGHRFDAYYDFLHIEEDRYQVKLNHDLRYSQGTFYLNATTFLEEGDELSYDWMADELTDLEWATGEPEILFSHRTEVGYSPNRFWQTEVWGQALWGSGPKGDGWTVGLEQNSTYHLFEARGLTREWMTLMERIKYQGIWGNDSAWYALVELSTSYYPTRYLSFGAYANLQHFSLTDENEYELGVSTTVQFAKLQATASYAYGQLDSGSFVPGVKEHRWGLGIKKLF